MQSNNPAIPAYTFSRLLKIVAKHVNNKNAGKPRFLVINAILHSLAALAATFSTVVFYCYFK